MSIRIKSYIKEDRGAKIGLVDFVVTYTPEKSETFSNVGHFKKEDREWLSVPACKRGESWVPIYERTPSLKDLFASVLKEMKTYLESKSSASTFDTPFDEPIDF